MEKSGNCILCKAETFKSLSTFSLSLIFLKTYLALLLKLLNVKIFSIKEYSCNSA